MLAPGLRALDTSALTNIQMELRKCCNHPFLSTATQASNPRLRNHPFLGTATQKPRARVSSRTAAAESAACSSLFCRVALFVVAWSSRHVAL